VPESHIATKPRWSRADVAALLALPFPELLFRAMSVHRAHFDPTKVQISTLLSIKTGGCPEDCGYCPQAAGAETGVKANKLMEVEKVLAEARAAKEKGASRFCMGAAWRSPKDHDLDAVCSMVAGVKALGMETCVTLGMLTPAQSGKLKEAGLDYYNHNLDTSPEYYGQIITTRTYQDRLDTLEAVRDAGINICCGGIVGMGEDESDRAGLLAQFDGDLLAAHPAQHLQQQRFTVFVRQFRHGFTQFGGIAVALGAGPGGFFGDAFVQFHRIQRLAFVDARMFAAQDGEQPGLGRFGLA